jgi:hypothetical protein
MKPSDLLYGGTAVLPVLLLLASLAMSIWRVRCMLRAFSMHPHQLIAFTIIGSYVGLLLPLVIYQIFNAELQVMLKTFMVYFGYLPLTALAFGATFGGETESGPLSITGVMMFILLVVFIAMP